MPREIKATREQLIAAWHDHQDEIEDLREQVSDQSTEINRLHYLLVERDETIQRLRGDLAHLYWLQVQGELLDRLYEWDHDPQGYRAGRTCEVCGIRSAKHAVIDDRHTDGCHLRPLEVALGIRKIGEIGSPPADVLGDDDG